jgi:hypothetical protein
MYFITVIDDFVGDFVTSTTNPRLNAKVADFTRMKLRPTVVVNSNSC